MYFLFAFKFFIFLKYCIVDYLKKKNCVKKILVWRVTFSFSVQAKLRVAYIVNITILKTSNPGRVTFFVKQLSHFHVTMPLSLEANIDITVEKSHCIIIVHESSWWHCMYAWLLALIKIIHCLSTSSNKVISSVPWYWFILVRST